MAGKMFEQCNECRDKGIESPQFRITFVDGEVNEYCTHLAVDCFSEIPEEIIKVEAI